MLSDRSDFVNKLAVVLASVKLLSLKCYQLYMGKADYRTLRRAFMVIYYKNYCIKNGWYASDVSYGLFLFRIKEIEISTWGTKSMPFLVFRRDWCYPGDAVHAHYIGDQLQFSNLEIISGLRIHRAELCDTSGILTGSMALNLKDQDDKAHDRIKKNGWIGRDPPAFCSLTA